MSGKPALCRTSRTIDPSNHSVERTIIELTTSDSRPGAEIDRDFRFGKPGNACSLPGQKSSGTWPRPFGAALSGTGCARRSTGPSIYFLNTFCSGVALLNRPIKQSLCKLNKTYRLVGPRVGTRKGGHWPGAVPTPDHPR